MLPRAHHAYALTLSIVALACLSSGCDSEGRPEALIMPLPAVNTEVVGNNVLVYNHVWDELWIFTPDGSGVRRSVVPMDAELVRFVALPESEMAILTREPATLTILGSDATVVDVVPLPSSYDRVHVDDSGRFFVFHYGPNSSGGVDDILFNAREMSIVDREATQGERVKTFTLAGFSPVDVVFAPEFTLMDPTRPKHYAVAMGPNALAFVDLTTTEDVDRQRTVPLVEPGSSRTVQPTGIHFSDDDPEDPFDMTAYVLVTGLDEIVAIDILPADPSTGREMRPSLNQLPTVVQPSQIHAYDVDGRTYLLVLGNVNEDIAIVDTATGAVERVSLGRRLSRAVLYEEDTASGVGQRALLYRPGQSVVVFVDLENLLRQGQSATRARVLGSSVSSIQISDVGGSRKAIVSYASSQGLGIIDLNRQVEVPITSRSALGEFVVVGDRFITTVSGVERLAVVDLVTESPSAVDIPARATGLEVLPGAGTLVVVHPHSAGWLSFYNLAELASGPYASERGFYLNGFLNRSYAE